VLLTELTLRSPLEGLVATRLLEPGAVASPTTPVVSVASVRRVWATVAAPEETARRLSQGQTATVTLDALPGETFTGRIAQILPSADPQSASSPSASRSTTADFACARHLRPVSS
jgi:multidrug resistance efflux pump